LRRIRRSGRVRGIKWVKDGQGKPRWVKVGKKDGEGRIKEG
jgi:hypothetical protein